MNDQCDICNTPAERSVLCLSCTEAITRLVSISSRYLVEYDHEGMSYKLTAAPTEEMARQSNSAVSATPQARVVRRLVNFRL